jgi:hypothetical protein
MNSIMLSELAPISTAPLRGIRLTAVMPCLNEERTVGVCIEKALIAFSAA